MTRQCSKVHASYHGHTLRDFFQLCTFPSVNLQKILTKIAWIHLSPLLLFHGVDVLHHLPYVKSVCVLWENLILYFYHSNFVSFKLLSCFCSQNLFKLFQIHTFPVFASEALDVAYLLSVRHIKTIPTSNAILAFTWKSSNFSSSLNKIKMINRCDQK